jgi:thiol-disulfide isomerase/thioredoxin
MKLDAKLPRSLHRRHFLTAGLSLLAVPAAAKPQNIRLPKLDAPLITALGRLDHIAGAPFSPPAGKVAVVTFFASWCPPCRTEFRHLSAVQRHYPASDLNIVAINLFETWAGQSNAARLDRFLKDTKPRFTVIRGNDGISQRFGGITRIPTLLVFDRRGRMAYRFIHKTGATKQQVEEAELRQVLDGIL